MTRHGPPLRIRVRNRWLEAVLCWETDPVTTLTRTCSRLRFHRGAHRGRSDARLAALARRRGWDKHIPGA